MFDCNNLRVCFEKIHLFTTISLLVRTVAQIIKDSGNNINSQFKNKQMIFSAFSWVLMS